MSGHWSEPEAPERPVETRLRRALAARAEHITLVDLRPADPPGPHLRRTPLARLRLRRFGLPLAGLVTAAAVAIGYIALAPGHHEQRPLPASTPGPVQPTPTPAHSKEPGPRPSPAPSDAPSSQPSRRPATGPRSAPPEPSTVPPQTRPSRAAAPRRSVPPATPQAH
ncbi:hypothetical protein [Streptomyces sp. NPDC051994]|uniref:hypothetical protein n=1 Tax=unclassified Streptomyces TaxID=2593676 RepID=UPI0034165835